MLADLEKIEQAITGYWGERCPDFDAGCPCCVAWQQYDKASGVAEGWRSMDSAPKDGETIVWLWYPEAGRATEGFTYLYGDGSVGSSSNFRGMEPSHWMPLPSAPSHQGRKE